MLPVMMNNIYQWRNRTRSRRLFQK